jgi:hypothetical protein
MSATHQLLNNNLLWAYNESMDDLEVLNGIFNLEIIDMGLASFILFKGTLLVENNGEGR